MNLLSLKLEKTRNLNPVLASTQKKLSPYALYRNYHEEGDTSINDSWFHDRSSPHERNSFYNVLKLFFEMYWISQHVPSL